MFLFSWKLKIATSPNRPTDVPPTLAPAACAQSSISERPRCLQIAAISSMRPGTPLMCTQSTARVRGPILRSMSTGSMQKVSSMSTIRGIAPERTTADTQLTQR